LKDVFSSYLAYENDGQSAGLRVKDSPEKGKMVTPLKDGSYIRYTRVNFADGSANGQAHMRGILSMHARVASYTGGKIEVRLDHPKGKKVGTMEVPKRGNGDKWFTVSTMIDTNPTDGAYGIHDLYLVFTRENKAKGPMFNVSKFEFSDEKVEPTAAEGL
jgi:glucuronoarabinoxylan endo-1,4-beta-xylanase